MISKRYRTNKERKDAMVAMNNKYARVFGTQEGQEVLDFMVQMELTGSIADMGDNLLDIGVKQGRANHVKDILDRITNSKNNS